jgi:hypothetical protein
LHVCFFSPIFSDLHIVQFFLLMIVLVVFPWPCPVRKRQGQGQKVQIGKRWSPEKNKKTRPRHAMAMVFLGCSEGFLKIYVFPPCQGL